MAILSFSRKKDGGKPLSPHFRVADMACRDGADDVLVDTALIALLEDIRLIHGGCPVRVSSGYRTVAHNRACGGAANSYHLKGMAADIRALVRPPVETAAAAEMALFAAGRAGGVGLYGSFVHVDTRTARWRANQITGRPVAGFAAGCPTLRRGRAGRAVEILQLALAAQGWPLTRDGRFGPATAGAVVAFQHARGLTADGVAGPDTWSALLS